MLVPGIGDEFHAYRRSEIALCATRTELRLLVMILSPFVRYWLTRLTIIGLWLSPERMWQLICRRLSASRQMLLNLLSLSRTMV